jgi:hypothetical protein
MLFWPSPAQAASANGSSSIAARFAEFPKMLSVFRMFRHRAILRTFADKMEFASQVIGTAPARANGAGRSASTAAAGNGKRTAAMEILSAVVTVMHVMPVMMAAHFGIGLQHGRLHLHGFGGRGGMARALGGASHRGRGENGNREQCC